ncbi:MAG: hypothetical protein ACK41E_10410 [Deinococcales bacterium]
MAFFTAKSGDTRKISRDSLDRLLALSVPFLLEYIDWTTVKRCVFFAYQQFQYVYPSPAQNLEQHLMIMPRQNYAGQLNFLPNRFLCAKHNTQTVLATKNICLRWRILVTGPALKQCFV